MGHYRFFIDKNSFLKDKVIIKDENLIHQIFHVLRLKIGDEIVVLDNTGFEYSVILEKIDKTIEGHIFKKEKNKNEPKIKIILLQSLLKHDKFEQVLKFGTSLGISNFIPIITEKSIVREINQNKFIRYQKIIKESAEQSHRGLLPKLENLITFKESLKILNKKIWFKTYCLGKRKKNKTFFFKKY